MEGRTAVCVAGNWIPVGFARVCAREIRRLLLNQLAQTLTQFPSTEGERAQSAVSRKSSTHSTLQTTVPHTDTGGQVEKTKTNE